MGRTVLVNAGPWLAVPPSGYGGIENFLDTLIPQLRRRGHRVVLASVAESRIEVDRLVYVFDQGQFEHLAEPYNRVVGLAQAHMQRVIEELREARDIDIVHDHQEVLGAGLLALFDGGPPALQTLHWDLAKHGPFYPNLDGRRRVFFNGVSRRQIEIAPPNLRRQTLGAIPLAVKVERFPYSSEKDDLFAIVGRLTPEKGADIAARVCSRRGMELRMAGPVAGLESPEALAQRLSGADGRWRTLRDVRYYLEEVRPLESERVRWVGSLDRAATMRLMARARASIFPIRWEEPGATAAIESLACGTPIVALRRGALRDIVEHGVTGFLADSEDELAGYLPQVGELDPAQCRRAAEEHFSAGLMAERYIELYEEVIARASGVHPKNGLENLALARGQLGE
jgi:glycosyltransferase involved in cell wall biosynthesis